MAKTGLDQLLSEAADKIRQEAYSAGWRDALLTVTKAVNKVAEPPPARTSASIILASTTSRRINGFNPGGAPWRILQALKKREGMTSAELIDVVQEGSPKTSNSAIRTALMRLQHKKLVVARHRKWFLHKPPRTA